MSKKSAPIVAIVGRANVGKSSLFNALVGRREAIVAREPGTTRDNVTAKASFEGKDFWLVDTAGLKDPADDFELTIQEQIIQAADSADIVLVVVAADVEPTTEDRQVAKLALKTKKPVLLVINKADRASGNELSTWLRLGIKTSLAISATQKKGLDELMDELSSNLPPARIKEEADRIRVALLGRPNVGKSSLFNSLVNKQQAIVASKAGTTRDVNRRVVRYMQREIELLDTAGIRRSGKIARGVEHFSVLRSLAAIEESDIGLLLMDAEELNVQLDQKIAGLVKDASKGLVLVVSKWDTADKEMTRSEKVGAEIASHFPFVGWAPLVFTSAITGQNVTKLFELILKIDKVRRQKFKTAELNRWLQQAVYQHPPAGLSGRQPKLRYMIQETEDFPSFKIYGVDTKYVHWSYKRYLERRLRESWPLGGTPIKFWFIEKARKDKIS